MFPNLLIGKSALVTGAGSGIGRGSALALAASGAAVTVNDIDQDGALATVEMINAQGGEAAATIGDVTDEDSVRLMFDDAQRHFGIPTIFHANAGFERYAELEVAELTDIEHIIAVDFLGALLCVREAVRRMKGTGGSIIITSSVQATHSLPGATTYAGTKAGVVAAARTLAVEVGVHGIRVNCLSPGTIETPMLVAAMEHMRLGDAATPEELVSSANALKRIGTVDEVGHAVVFLASDASSYVTGTNLVVDGGFTAVKAFG
jgi:NAD(P)-dependent dehydrogenase (short-subunit alcohol dehydrogenase family)